MPDPPGRCAAFLLVAAGLLSLAACRVDVRTIEVEPLEPPIDTTTITAPVRAHLTDGSVVVFRDGVTVGPDRLVGPGIWYSLTRSDSAAVGSISIDSLGALESFSAGLDRTRSAVLTSVGTGAAVAGAAVGAVGLLKALFGSCPTVYTTAAGGETLEAELFSYSIAPLFEMRDVDGIAAAATPDGMVRLEVRNEALETHYINHLELIEVRHSDRERVVPDERGRPVALGDAAPPVRATDRGGRDVRRLVAAADGQAFGSDPARLATAVEGDFHDHVDLTFPGAATDQAALVLTLRNSLLNTVLFYDVMLGSGARAVEWLGSDMEEIGRAAEMGAWYSEAMGIRASVLDGGAWREAGRIPDVGPIAWKTVAVTFRPPPGDSIRIRLSFLTDGYRLDAALLALEAREPEGRPTGPVLVVGTDGAAAVEALGSLAEPDHRYVTTGPGDRFEVTFDVGPEPVDGARSFLLSSQGYYIEWVRGDWVRDPGAPAFSPGDEALRSTYRRWRDVRESFEARFYGSRVPVR